MILFGFCVFNTVVRSAHAFYCYNDLTTNTWAANLTFLIFHSVMYFTMTLLLNVAFLHEYKALDWQHVKQTISVPWLALESHAIHKSPDGQN